MELKEKEIVDGLTAQVKEVSELVKSMKIKGDKDATEADSKLKTVKDAVDKAMATHDLHSDTMKKLAKSVEDVEKAIGDLDLRTKNMNVFNAGLVDASGFRKLHKDMQKDFEQCIQTGRAVNMKMKVGEFNALMMKGRINKAAGNMTEAGNFSGDFVIEPERLPGFFAPPLRPVHIREFINQSTTESNLINYILESGFNDGSGSTAQGSAAAQSDYNFTANQCIVQKINAYFTLAKEMLADTPITENYIRVRGVGRLMMFEDTALLNGNGIAPNQNGIIPVASAYSNPVIPGATPSSINYYDVLHTAVTQAKVAYYVPNIIILHPNDYNTLALSRDTYGRYQFPQMVTGAPGEFYINGALVVQNTAMTAGTFLLGDFAQGATMFTRDEVGITFSNQHVDNFIKGFITVMIEERIGNVIYRPTAFITGNLITGEISGS